MKTVNRTAEDVSMDRSFWARKMVRTALPMELTAEEALLEWSREFTNGTRGMEWLPALELRYDRLVAQEETGVPAAPVYVERLESNAELNERRATWHTGTGAHGVGRRPTDIEKRTIVHGVFADAVPLLRANTSTINYIGQ